MAQGNEIGIWILAVTVTVCLIPVKGIINCTSRMERGNAYEQCFNDQGLEAPDVFESYRTSDSDDLDEVPVEELFIHYGDSFCTNHLTELKEAVRCSYQIDTDCTDSVLERSLMPSPDDMARTVDPVCNNLENLDFACIEGRQQAAGECGARRATSELQTISDVTQLICLTRIITAECVKEEFKPCGCTSSRVYSNFTMGILLPDNCDQTTARVICSQTNPNEFVDDGLNGGPKQGLAMSLMAVVTVLVLTVAF